MSYMHGVQSRNNIKTAKKTKNNDFKISQNANGSEADSIILQESRFMEYV